MLLIASSFAPAARAATPTLNLTARADASVLVLGSSFPPSSPVSVEATLPGGSGSMAVASAADGTFKAILKLSPMLAGDSVTVIATSGDISASASIYMSPQQPAPAAPLQAPVPAVAIPKAATAPVVPAPAAVATAVRPNGPSGNWRLVFGDEFQGAALDQTKWVTCFHWGCDGANKDNESQTYAPGNVTVSGGAARLTIKKNGTDAAHPYTSGMLTASLKSQFTYGYMEMRAQLPACAGCWPAFWAVPNDLSWPPEIDVMEGLGNSTNEVSTNYHWEAGGHQQSGPKAHTPGVDFSKGFHTYGAEWSSTGIAWYIDGKLVDRYNSTTTLPKVPMYVIANLAIERGRGAPPEGKYMDIDYIRVFQRA